MAERLSTGLRNEILKAGGKSFADAMLNGVLHIYSGTQPANADTTEGAGTLLNIITLGSGAFTSGTATNGLEFDAAASGVLSKKAGEVWSGAAIASGTATWFRFYGNTVVTGASTTAIRFDGAVATSGAELNLANTTITSGATTTIDTFEVTFPAS